MKVAGILVLDLDGTVAVGDEPVLAYARAVARELSAAGLTDAAAALEPAVQRFLDGDRDDSLAETADGYLATARVATAAGLDPTALNRAYRESRELVHDGSVPVFAPDGLARLLDSLRPDIHIVLVSNAPEAGLAEVLGLLGLGESFDEIKGDAGKPTGMSAIIARLLDAHGLTGSPRSLLSVGDIWVNDLEPVAAIDGVTAMVDRWERGYGDPGHRAQTVEALYPAIMSWADRVRRVNGG